VIVDSSVSVVLFRLAEEGDSEFAPFAKMEIQKPDGTAISHITPGVEYEEYARGSLYKVKDPMTGIWTTEVTRTTGIPYDYVFAAFAPGALDIEIAVDRNQYSDQAQLPLRVFVPPQATNVDARMDFDNVWGWEEFSGFSLYDDGANGDGAAGDGLFAYDHPWPMDDGESWRLLARVSGELPDGSAFTRVAERSIYVRNASVLGIPAGATASTNLVDQVSLLWGSVANATHYDVLRNFDSNPHTGWDLVGVVESPTVSFVDTDVDPGQVYYYKVRAFAGSRLDSDFSEIVAGSATGP
jgi:hypothetical protein